MNKLILFLLLFFVHWHLSSQSYFQQQVNYNIEVTLNDSAKTLKGSETIEYTNNSPDTLQSIYFHLWANAYRNNHTPFAKQQLAMGRYDFTIAHQSERGYMDSLDFSIDGKKITWEYTDKSHEIVRLMLNQPVLPKQTISIFTPFFVKLPFLFSRMGYDNKGHISVTQWYPKPAVYDQYGWHTFHYLDLGEFYSEFGNFDVSITVPKYQVVAATGNLITSSELKFLENRINNPTLSIDSTILKQIGKKTIQFTQKNVHDFAWFVSPKFIIEKDSIILSNGHAVETWLFYLPENKAYYKNMLPKINRSVRWFSEWNGDYPYKTVKVVDGGLLAGGGMEYPTITVISSMRDTIALEETIIHEIGHNWFYGILGFNERQYPFLDEGINTSNQLRYMQRAYPQLQFGENYLPKKIADILGLTKYPQRFNMLMPYLVSACSYSDCPTNTHSENMTPTNYETVVYMKTAYLFYYLRYYLGETLYNKAMHDFYKKWQFKHPYPEDLKSSFETSTGKDLSWFFDQTIATSYKADYKVVKANSKQVILKNTGKIEAPFEIGFYQSEELIGKQWIEGFTKKQAIQIPDRLKNYDFLLLNPEQQLYELPSTNNFSRRKGLFKKIEPLHFSLLANIEKPTIRQLYFCPIIGGNRHNNFMVGMALYNSAIFKKRIEFQLMPLFSFSNNPFAGMGAIHYNWFQPQTSFLRLIKFKISAQQFALWNDDRMSYQRYNGQVLFLFDGKHFDVTHQFLQIDNLYVTNWLNQFYYGNKTYRFYNRINFTQYSSNKIAPYRISLNILSGENFSRAEIEGSYKYVYDWKKHFIGLRFFAGKFIFNETADPTLNFRLSGTNGTNDITYDHLYLARNYFHTYSDFFAQQFTDNQGGFSFYSPFQDNSWMTSAQLRTSFPAPKFLHAYLNAASFGQSESIFNSPFVYEIGIEAELIPNILKIYFPITGSHEIIDVNNLYTANYLQKIRFVLNFTVLNPFKLYDKILYHFGI